MFRAFAGRCGRLRIDLSGELSRISTPQRLGRFFWRIDMELSRTSLPKLPLVAAMLAWAFALIAVAVAPASATTGQTSITLVGGVATVVQHDDTAWDSTKT